MSLFLLLRINNSENERRKSCCRLSEKKQQLLLQTALCARPAPGKQLSLSIKQVTSFTSKYSATSTTLYLRILEYCFHRVDNLSYFCYRWLSDNALSNFPHPLLSQDGFEKLKSL